MRCIIIITALSYDFENANHLRCTELSKSTKIRQRMVEVCGTVLLLINFVEIKKT